jgi:hypothetical protein
MPCAHGNLRMQPTNRRGGGAGTEIDGTAPAGMLLAQTACYEPAQLGKGWPYCALPLYCNRSQVSWKGLEIARCFACPAHST